MDDRRADVHEVGRCSDQSQDGPNMVADANGCLRLGGLHAGAYQGVGPHVASAAGFGMGEMISPLIPLAGYTVLRAVGGVFALSINPKQARR